MNGGDHLIPGVVISTLVKHDVSVTDRVSHQVLPSELGGHSVLLPQREVLVLHIHSKHRRMVSHLTCHMTTARGEREGESKKKKVRERGKRKMIERGKEKCQREREKKKIEMREREKK